MALDAILSHKREEVAARRSATSLESLLARATPSRRSFGAAIRNRRPAFILEIKFASPSAGVIRQGADLEPMLRSYGRHADAVSVLTDRRFFGGSLERLAEVRSRLEQPLLCKDFILDPYQVAEARVYGADAVLLILAAVTDDAWRACAAMSERLGMEVLTEVHDEAEAGRAERLGARIVGINNRDLRTLAVDLGTTSRVAPRIASDRLVISESGIESRETVRALREHADAFLVGSALMRAHDLDAAARELVHGRTKICGLTRPEHAAAACAAGATHGGVMFATGSPRRIGPGTARHVMAGAPLQWVGVFADQPAEYVARIAGELGLGVVQLHGTETRDEIAALRTLLPEGTAVWKAHWVRGELPRTVATGADRVLLDGWAAGRQGGTGQAFDWSLLDSYPERGHVVLAGGLRPDNVAAAARHDTWALDVSSGVESSPGTKDPMLLEQFFSARRRLPGRGDAAE